MDDLFENEYNDNDNIDDENGDDNGEDMEVDEDNNEENEENDENEEEEEEEDDDEDDEDNEDEDEDEEEGGFVDAKEPSSGQEEAKHSNLGIRESIIKRAKVAKEFDIVPSVAMPYATQCHAFAFSDGPKYIVTGGEDGFIRKYDFIASIQGKLPLTMAQKHNLIDSVTKAGIINSYWENEQPLTKAELLLQYPKIKQSDFTSGSVTYEPKISPVYALDVERNGYWCLSGVQSGGISLYTMRYNEGQLHHYFRHSTKKGTSTASGHSDAISQLKLNQSQTHFLSGSWDKSIREWDLDTGKCTRVFTGSSGQISQIKFRPQGLGDLTLQLDSNTESDMESLFGDSDEEKEQPKKKKKPANSKVLTNDNVFMNSSSDGTINIWDVRSGNNTPVIRYGVPAKTPPWCVSATWANSGDSIFVGRRNSTIDEMSLKMPNVRNGSSYTPNVLKTLHFPKISGPVTALATMPNDNFLLCGSQDNIRLYNLGLYNPEDPSTTIDKKVQATPFLIVPGHQGGVLSSLHVDETGRFMVSASGNRGWGNATHTDSVIVYEIDFE